MKKLTALFLSAAIIPAFALSTTAIAENHEDKMKADSEQRSGEQHADEKKHADKKRTGEAQLSGKPSGAFHATDVIGSNVKHRESDEDVGEIQDLIIGEDGRIVGVVVTTSGFLGLDGQDTGLGWDHIEHSMEDDESVFYTDIDEESLRESPRYERN